MKQPALVIIKPDGVQKGQIGTVFIKFAQIDLEMVALKLIKPTRAKVEEHYRHLKEEKFFENVVSHFLGQYHHVNKLPAIIFYGEKAIQKCRKIAGKTDPEEARPDTIRGACGRTTTQGLFENVVHVSSNATEAKREIQLWFEPQEILVPLYTSKKEASDTHKRKIWA